MSSDHHGWRDPLSGSSLGVSNVAGRVSLGPRRALPRPAFPYGVGRGIQIVLLAISFAILPSGARGDDPVGGLVPPAPSAATESKHAPSVGEGDGGGRDPDIDALLHDLEERADDLHYGSLDTLVGLHGFIDNTYQDLEGATSTFDNFHTNIFLDVFINEHVSGKIEIEYEHSGDAFEVDRGEVLVRPWLDHDLVFAAGRTYAVFGIERRNWYPPKNPLVSRPRVHRVIVPGNWYETGARMRYRRELAGLGLDLEAGITNGLGASADTDIRGARQARDNNDNKTISGRFAVSPCEGLDIGVSGSTGKYDDAGNDRIDLYGVDLVWKWDRLTVQAEAIKSHLEATGGATGAFSRRGAYVQASWTLYRDDEELVDASGRFGIVDPNTDVADAEDRRSYSAGVRWRPFRDFTLKAEGQVFDALHGRIDSHSAVLLQVVLDF